MFTVGNAASHYYNELEADPTEDDFSDWLTGLPGDFATSFRKDDYKELRDWEELFAG